jgi:chemotaxis protein CheD
MTTAVEQMVTVGLGELKWATEADVVLMALGLGSCVGVALYDPKARVGAMVHVVLPAPLDTSGAASAKFATSAIPLLLDTIQSLGGERHRLVCKLAGGAQVLTTAAMKDNFRIGERNQQAVLDALQKAGLRPHAVECGGTTGRSFRLRMCDGSVAVKRLGQDWQAM